MVRFFMIFSVAKPCIRCGNWSNCTGLKATSLKGAGIHLGFLKASPQNHVNYHVFWPKVQCKVSIFKIADFYFASHSCQKFHRFSVSKWVIWGSVSLNIHFNSSQNIPSQGFFKKSLNYPTTTNKKSHHPTWRFPSPNTNCFNQPWLAVGKEAFDAIAIQAGREGRRKSDPKIQLILNRQTGSVT